MRPFRVFIFENMAGQVFIVPITDSVLILEFCKFWSFTISVGSAENYWDGCLHIEIIFQKVCST
jgi:hypothetical protein